MALNISEARVKQIRTTIEGFMQAFTQFDEKHTAENLTAYFDENIHWYDHGFHVVRVGHEAIVGLCKGFTFCNQNFKAELKSFYPTTDGAAVEQIWTGTCENDIVRPNGDVIIKANGRDFTQYVGFFIKVNEDGKITRIDEYDHRNWPDGKAEQDYVKMGSVKL